MRFLSYCVALAALCSGSALLAEAPPAGQEAIEAVRPPTVVERDRKPAVFIPQPPRIWDPWWPPKTSIPAEALDAVAKLYELRMPDPRGCEYRRVTVTTRPQGGGPAETHAWLVPTPPGVEADREVMRCAICWNGQVHPVIDVGEPARIVDDVNKALAVLTGDAAVRSAFRSVRVDAPHPVRIALLLRLGEVELAERLYVAGYEGPAASEADRFYVDAGDGWARTTFRRLVAAHRTGDHDLGELIGRNWGLTIHKFVDEAERRGVDDAAERYAFLSQAKALAATQSRLRAPILPPRGRARDRAGPRPSFERERELMAAARQTPLAGPRWTGGLYFDLIKEPSIRQLIESAKSPYRSLEYAMWAPTPDLTRIVDRSGEMPFVLTDADVATFALREVLQGGSSPEDFAEFWKAARGGTRRERLMALLAEPNASTRQWIFAGERLAGNMTPWRRPPPDAAQPSPDPDVVALVATRFRQAVSQLEADAEQLDDAVEFATLAATLETDGLQPVFQELFARLRGFDATAGPPAQWWNRDRRFNQIGQIAAFAARGDRSALQPYVKWLRSLPTSRVAYFPERMLQPLWEFPDEPIAAEAAEWFFEGEDSPWRPRFLDDSLSSCDPSTASGVLAALHLLRVRRNGREGAALALQMPAFRRLVVRLLNNRCVLGATRRQAGNDETPKFFIFSKFVSASVSMPSPARRPIVLEEQPIRAADLIAWRLVTPYERTPADSRPPAFSPLWTVTDRNSALAEIRAFLRGDKPPIEAPQP